ncbi:hypothetical protein JYG23_13365 [Sedimentibacter sp. zth1]|uniref:hypothetical protein n=1 Tax=Sedimentibacter sp. zth1 TaxID=2816908 RepID=UPI001A928D5A|nr:hypothetical protein [Sedimentibacter sp. zth1]QSX05639.1 hypothetical protein JYG23_13365 [Sedimentibacter sp. zth1]
MEKSYIHYKRLRKSCQKLLLDAIEKKVPKRKFRNLKNKLYAKYPEEFYVYGKDEVKNKKSAVGKLGDGSS